MYCKFAPSEGRKEYLRTRKTTSSESWVVKNGTLQWVRTFFLCPDVTSSWVPDLNDECGRSPYSVLVSVELVGKTWQRSRNTTIVKFAVQRHSFITSGHGPYFIHELFTNDKSSSKKNPSFSDRISRALGGIGSRNTDNTT